MKVIPKPTAYLEAFHSKELDSLNQRERLAIKRYACGASLEKIADEWSVTRERVRQILMRAAIKLKINIEELEDPEFTIEDEIDANGLREFIKLVEISAYRYKDENLNLGDIMPEIKRKLIELVHSKESYE